ncbi:hypothetical protein ENKOMM089B3_18585 [Enterobacter kobei]|nr:Uncharacterised protein [Enterobacter kobei]VAL68574.1 Uncharacterised protein [Enterobacter kobei]
MHLKFAAGVERQIAVAARGAIGLHACCQRAGAGNRFARQADVALCSEGAAVLYGVGARKGDVSGRPDRAAILNTPVGGEGDCSGFCANIARVAHADAFFRPDQTDFPGVHAADLGDIQRHDGFCRTVIRKGGHLFMRRIHRVAPGSDA